MNIDGRAAIVTGAASGLGAATARALAEAGAKVTLLDLNADSIRTHAAEVGGHAVVCDVTDENSVADALAEGASVHGPARILVNCAGIVAGARMVGRKGPMALDAFAKVITVNLIGTFNVMRLAAAAMAESPPLADDPDGERGVIVNTASIAAFEGQIGQSAYAASKGGVAALTLPIARELAPLGIRVMAIAPGFFETPMTGGMPDQVRQSLIDTTLHPHRMGRPEEFAATALHILRTPMLNGSVIRLDGAVRMAPQ